MNSVSTPSSVASSDWFSGSGGCGLMGVDFQKVFISIAKNTFPYSSILNIANCDDNSWKMIHG